MLSSKIIKKITACCCMAAVMLAASGCSDSKSYVSNSNEPKELKITYVKSPLNIPSIIDKNLQTVSKEFAKTDTKISYPEINSGAKQTEALAAGSLDICSALGGTSAILAASNGVDLKNCRYLQPRTQSLHHHGQRSEYHNSIRPDRKESCRS